MIFCPLSGGKIEAFNAKTLESVWVFTDVLGGQNNTPITYHDGYVYTGYWNGEAKDGNFVCVNAATGELVWSKTTLGGHYWSGSAVIGDAVIVGTDDGKSGWTGDSHLYALNRLTGEVISDITLTGMGDQRSTIAYSAEKGRVYFTTKNGYIASAAVNATTGALSDLKSSKISTQATATPVVYGDKVYVGAGGGMQVGATNGNLFAIDANSLEYLYEVPLKGYPQGSIMISTAYLAETGKLYCYATYNSQPGGMTLIKIDPNATTVDGIQLEEIFDAGDHPQYCLISPICGPDGTIYYRNDSGCLFALTTNNAYLTGLTASVGTFTQEFAPGRHNYELVVPVGTQSVTLTPAACDGGVTEAVTATLVDGIATATVTVTKGNESRTYTVSVRTVSTNASLGSLKVNEANSYGGTISPDVTPEEHYYTYLTAGSSRTFMNVWPDVADEHATLKVYPMDNATGQKASSIAEDGSMNATATNQGHKRFAVYFVDATKPMAVRIEVTSENGEIDNYYVVISKEAAAEDGKALLERIKADNKLAADQAVADPVMKQIDAIGTVTLDSKTAIEAARAAYDALTDAQKALITNYETLTAAESSLKALQDAADKAAADKAAADPVIEKINAIGTVTLETKTTIEAARAAYNALTADQKALVRNYDVLTAAEVKLAELKQAASENPDKPQTKVEITEGGITTVPESLKQAGLDTPEEVKQEMMEAIIEKNKETDQKNVAHYDVALMYSEDGGKTWIKADETHFPANGKITVTIPYPAGTDSTYDFTVVHMFTSNAFGKTPGDVEKPKVTKTKDGIQFEVTGLSPISVGWTAPKTSDNPQTGDNTNIALYTSLMLVSFAGLAAVMYFDRKRKYAGKYSK